MSENRFQECPRCGKSNGYFNNNRHHWGVCDEHRLTWYIGSNLFSSWKDETEEDWAANRERFASYEVVDREQRSAQR